MEACNCPQSDSLLEIVAQACGVDLKQIQKLAFQRYQATAPFTATSILLLATWQALMTAEDNTKIVVTPMLGGDPVIEAGEAITTGGGDNSTIDGIEEYEGTNPSQFSAVFKSLAPATEKQMKALICETDLTVYLFLQGGRIAVVRVPQSDPAEYKGFGAHSFFLSDRNNAGFGAKDNNNISFYLKDGWSEDLEIIKPNFNPLTDL